MTNKDVTAAVKGIQIIHFALVVGLIFFAIFFTTMSQAKLNVDLNDQWFPFIAVATGIAAMNLMLSKILFEKLIAPFRTNSSIEYNIQHYRKAFIMKLALLEFSALFSLIITFLSGSIITLALAILVIILLVTQRPSVHRLAEDLHLSPGQVDILD